MGTRSDSAGAAGSRKREKQSLGQFLKELPVLIVVALGIAILVKTFVVQAFFIPSGSMEDTLLINDRVIVSKFVYRFSEPSYPNIVVFVSPLNPPEVDSGTGPVGKVLEKVTEGLGLQSSEQDFIKRIMATEGQTIEIKDGAVYVDGQRKNEPYLKEETPLPDYGPTLVPQDHIFVMGDNRFSSEDSRVFGPVPESSIIGRAVVRIWPVNRIDWIGSGQP